MVTCNAYATRRNKNGERGSPCLSLLSIANSFVGEPLNKIETVADLKHPIIQEQHLIPKPIWAITSIKNSQFTLSNGFSKSTLNNNKFISCFFAEVTTSLAINAPSSMFLPATKAVWLGEMTLWITLPQRLAKTFSIALHVQPIRLIGRKFAIQEDL